MLDTGMRLRGHLLCGNGSVSSYEVILKRSVEALMTLQLSPGAQCARDPTVFGQSRATTIPLEDPRGTRGHPLRSNSVR